jgi:methanogen homocitrate synthase
MNLEQTPWCTDDWWVSHYNYVKEVRAGFQLPERVQIHDATLRDGEQTPGVVFRIEDKVAIAKALDGAGIDRIEDSIRYAKSKGLYVVFFPYDTSRADIDVVRELVGGVTAEADPDAIAIVDTVGAALPDAVRYMVRQVKSVAGGRPLEIHTHNDFGLGVAGSLAAVAEGAEVVHVSVNGLGERTGNAPLEETAVSLRMLYDLPLNVQLDRLVPLSRLVEELSGVPVAANKPVSGATAFSRESGAGIDMLLEHPTVVMPVHPRTFGREVNMVLGKKSGRRSIQLKLEEWGIEATNDQLEQMRDLVKSQAIRKKAALSDAEFREIVDQVLT